MEKKERLQKTSKLFITAAISLAVVFGVVKLSAGWTSPTGAPSVSNGLFSTTSTGVGFSVPGANFPLDLYGEMVFREKYTYEKTITITNNSGGELTDYETLVTVDTASLIAAGKMQADCDDIRFMNPDSTTLTHWLESGCNSTSTQIWVRIPSLPVSGRTIYLLYGNTSAPSASLSWTGSFVFMSTSSCPSGWTRVTALDSRFPRGAATYGGTGGAETETGTHTHTWTATTDGPSATYNTRASSYANMATSNHTHLFNGTTGSAANLPPYLDVVFCSSSQPPLLTNNFIAYFDANPSSPWSNFSALNNTFARGSDTYGGTGGTTPHTHTFSGTSNTATNTQTSEYTGTSAARSIHTHTLNGTTEAALATPPYVDMIVAKPSSSTSIPSGIVALTSALPPMGWTRFSELDGRFPRGSSTHGAPEDAHSHNIGDTQTSNSAIAQSIIADTSRIVASSNHYHHATGSAATSDTPPPYLDVLFYQKNSQSSVSVNVGSERSSEHTAVKMVFDSSGNIGINNLSPAYSLDVSGLVRVTATTTVMGSMGVKTTSPAAALDVNGTTKFAHWAEESLGQNGYARIGSVLFQWGKNTSGLSGEGSFTITYPTPFNELYSVDLIEDITGYTNVDQWIQVKNVNDASFDVFIQSNGGSNPTYNLPVYWMATGR